jgi:hypothetical protein
MTQAIPLALAIVTAAALYALVRVTARTYLKFRGTRVVTCPETKTTAALALDAGRAARTAGLDEPEMRVASCSHWPEREQCGQRCLAEIRSAPDGCLARAMLGNWYLGKACVLCGRAFGEIDWMERKPALMSPERQTLEWHEVPAESLPRVLSTHRPVCWSCHIAESFRREHPELVVERPAPHRHVA